MGSFPWLMLIPVGVGGAVGACLRYGVWAMVSVRSPEHPYVATILVNVVGSVALGTLAGAIAATGVGSAGGGAMGGVGPGRVAGSVGWLEAGVMMGLIGALTTYSTFAVDAVKLVHAGRFWHALGYVGLMTVVCLAGAGVAYGGVVWGAARLAGGGAGVGLDGGGAGV